MHLTHQRTAVPGQRSPGRVQALAWSPGCLRLAVAGRDRVVQLFDERGERRDKFSTKPGDARVGAPAVPLETLPPSPAHLFPDATAGVSRARNAQARAGHASEVF